MYGGAPHSFRTENSYIVGTEHGISRTEVSVLTTELRGLSFDDSVGKHVPYNGTVSFIFKEFKKELTQKCIY